MQGYSRRAFEAVAWLEGLSYLGLLAVAMPLKYLAGAPLATTIAGLIHGLAFVAYAVMVIDALATKQWSGRTAALGLLAAMLPAGTFVFVGHARRVLAASAESAAGAPRRALRESCGND